MAKKFQALKFTEGLEEDLRTLARMKGVTYNAFIEGILSNHVLTQKRMLREITDKTKKVIEERLMSEQPIEVVGIPGEDYGNHAEFV